MTPQQREEFEKKFGKAGPERNCDSIGRNAGCDDCSENIKLREEYKSFIDKTVNQAREEEKNRINEQFCAFMHVIRGSSGKNQLSKIAQVMVAFRRSLITPTTN